MAEAWTTNAVVVLRNFEKGPMPCGSSATCYLTLAERTRLPRASSLPTRLLNFDRPVFSLSWITRWAPEHPERAGEEFAILPPDEGWDCHACDRGSHSVGVTVLVWFCGASESLELRRTARCPSERIE